VQKLISKYGLAAHLALLAVASLFLTPVCVFWLTGIAAVWLLMEPSRIGGEMLHEARARVIWSIFTDPFFWLSLLLVVYAGMRFWNDGVTMSYDAELAVWSISKPKMSLMPGSVAGYGAPEFACSLAFLVILQGCRHALGRSARLAFFLCASALAGLGAGIMAVLYPMGNELVSALIEVSKTCPSYLGSAFGAYLLAGIVALLGAYERKWLKVMLLTILSIGGNAAGLFLFSPAPVQVVYGSSCILLLVYTFIFARRRLPGTGEFKFLVTFSIAITLGVVLVMSVMPQALLAARTEPYMTGTFFEESFMAVRDSLSAIALKAWKEYPWLGNGIGSFPFNLRFHAVEADWALVVPEQVSPLNGFWYLLVERGIIGAVFIACPLGFLLWAFGCRLVRGIRLTMPHPACWAGMLALISLITETFVDISFSLPGMMLVVVTMLALAANSFPKEKHDG